MTFGVGAPIAAAPSCTPFQENSLMDLSSSWPISVTTPIFGPLGDGVPATELPPQADMTIESARVHPTANKRTGGFLMRHIPFTNSGTPRFRAIVALKYLRSFGRADGRQAPVVSFPAASKSAIDWTCSNCPGCGGRRPGLKPTAFSANPRARVPPCQRPAIASATVIRTPRSTNFILVASRQPGSLDASMSAPRQTIPDCAAPSSAPSPVVPPAPKMTSARWLAKARAWSAPQTGLRYGLPSCAGWYAPSARTPGLAYRAPCSKPARLPRSFAPSGPYTTATTPVWGTMPASAPARNAA